MAAYDLTYSTARVNNEPSNQIWPSSSYQRGPGLLSAFPPETVTEPGSLGSRLLQTLDRARDPYVQNGTYAAQQSEVQHPAPAPPPQTHSANNSCSPPPSSLTSFYASSTSASTIMYASAELQLQLPSSTQSSTLHPIDINPDAIDSSHPIRRRPLARLCSIPSNVPLSSSANDVPARILCRPGSLLSRLVSYVF
jgi:hypothetical protein